MENLNNVQEIIAKFSPIGWDCDGIGNVQILDEESCIKFWIDVSVHNNDVITDWNQYIFMDNNSDDVMRKEIQEDINVAMLAFDCAVNYLLNNRCLYQSENGNWYESFEYWRNPTPAEIKAGQGAIHYLTLACSECLNKKGQPKKRLVYFRDRLTYYKK